VSAPYQYTVKQVVAELKKLERRWPDGYSLFSWSGKLCLMDDRKMQDGSLYGGSAHDAIVEDFSIPNDGGDPD
jgi:hypothetical protein